MLVLTRRIGDKIRLATMDGLIFIAVRPADHGNYRVAIQAPPSVRIVRDELEPLPVEPIRLATIREVAELLCPKCKAREKHLDCKAQQVWDLV